MTGRWMIAASLSSFLLLGLGCDDGGDGDGDADADADGDCGGLDELCCPGDSPCAGALICAGAEGADPGCYAACVPSLCHTTEATPRQGSCQDVSAGAGVGVCIHAIIVSDCDPTSPDPCTTDYGAEGICVVGSSGSIFCFEQCTPAETGCDDAHVCVPLGEPLPDGTAGACLPAG